MKPAAAGGVKQTKPCRLQRRHRRRRYCDPYAAKRRAGVTPTQGG